MSKQKDFRTISNSETTDKRVNVPAEQSLGYTLHCALI